MGISTSKKTKNVEVISELQTVYFLALLRRRTPLWNQDSTAKALTEARIDIIPHQVSAATFAFRNPLSGGVIIADEVGLGKTIEAGLVVTQLWYGERKRKILVIAPKTLRGQWKTELKDLFGLNSSVIESTEPQEQALRFLNQPEGILIMTEHTACKFLDNISRTNWDLILIDEAHKMRNAWKNEAKSRSVKLRTAFRPFRKILLTATPFQNNLMELFGLVSFIDDRVLGTSSSFRKTFVQVSEESRKERIAHLRDRMVLFFHRELRRNVLEYVRYTDRHAITVPYEPTAVEEELRTSFELYLRQENSIAIPQGAFHLLRLVYFKLLASSPCSLENSLLNLCARLARNAACQSNREAFDDLMTRVQGIIRSSSPQSQRLAERFETRVFDGCLERNYLALRRLLTERTSDGLTEHEKSMLEEAQVIEGDLECENPVKENKSVSSQFTTEAKYILNMFSACLSIDSTAKGKALLSVLKQQFETAGIKGWPKKAVIFTEFKSTQDYICRELQQMGLKPGEDIIIFNGDSGDSIAREVLVNKFRDTASVFLTTEAGAEGLNLQFCNLVINFDLPWNPQRIEQRIGRCHRYKQPLDVIVVNFVNKSNPADERIIQLLQEKFHLFEGVFGASDHVLGEILDGADFERKIFEIYIQCRDANEIKAKFDELMKTNSEKIEKTRAQTIAQLSELFSGDVLTRMKGIESQIGQVLNEQARLLKAVMKNVMPENVCQIETNGFIVTEDFYGFKKGTNYSFLPSVDKSVEVLNPSHPAVVSLPLPQITPGAYQFFVNSTFEQYSTLTGMTGYFWLFSFFIEGIDSEELIIPVFLKKVDGEFSPLDEALSVRLIEGASERLQTVFEAASSKIVSIAFDVLRERVAIHRQEFDSQGQKLFSEEMSKVRWLFDDQIRETEMHIQEIRAKISEVPIQMKSANSAVVENQIEAAQEKLERELIALEEKKIGLQKQSWDAKHARRVELEKAVTPSENTKLLAHGTFRIA